VASLLPVLYFGLGTSEPRIAEFVGHVGLKISDVLRGEQEWHFLLNAEAVAYLERIGLSPKRLGQVRQLPWDEAIDAATVERCLATTVPGLGPNQRRWVLEAMAVSAYHAQTGYPVVRLLMCDDVPAFNWVTDELALCWIHQGRHSAKLDPVLSHRATWKDRDRRPARLARGGEVCYRCAGG